MSQILLNHFWKKYGYKGSKRATSIHSPDTTLKSLIELANPESGYVNPQKRRNVFDRVKYKRHSLRSHALCFVCHLPGEVRHHIVPLSRGGKNSKRNLVTLCHPCHALIHPWLRSS